MKIKNIDITMTAMVKVLIEGKVPIKYAIDYLTTIYERGQAVLKLKGTNNWTKLINGGTISKSDKKRRR